MIILFVSLLLTVFVSCTGFFVLWKVFKGLVKAIGFIFSLVMKAF